MQQLLREDGHISTEAGTKYRLHTSIYKCETARRSDSGARRALERGEKILDFRGRFAVNPGGALWYS